MNLHINRSKLQEEFGRQINAAYKQWETDIEKAKEQEEKFNVRSMLHMTKTYSVHTLGNPNEMVSVLKLLTVLISLFDLYKIY